MIHIHKNKAYKNGKQYSDDAKTKLKVYFNFLNNSIGR